MGRFLYFNYSFLCNLIKETSMCKGMTEKSGRGGGVLTATLVPERGQRRPFFVPRVISCLVGGSSRGPCSFIFTVSSLSLS